VIPHGETFTQLHELLDRLRRIHHDASVCCRRAGESPDERLNLLADFFQQRQESLAASLDTSDSPDQAQGQAKALDTWIQFVPSRDVAMAMTELRQASKNNSQEVIRRAMELQTAIASLLAELSESVDGPEVNDLLTQLARMEASAAQQLGLTDVMDRDF
jgi:hypothetical protein